LTQDLDILNTSLIGPIKEADHFYILSLTQDVCHLDSS